MGQEFQVPAVFQGRAMAQAFAALNAHDDNLSEGIGQSYPVIGYKGKVWSIRYRGERKTVIRPDDGTPSAYLDVIVLGQAKAKSKSFYKKFDPATSDGDRPICSSIDGIVPDADVVTQQHTSCALCPRNVWKTDPQTGRKGRECTDYKRLAVLILPTMSKPTLGQALMEPAFLRVPPDSLNSLAIMGETMGQQGFHYSSYITRITFDPQKAHPCMLFRPLQGLTDGEAPVILEMRSEPAVGRITGGDIAAAGLKAVEQSIAAPGTNATGLGAVATQATSPAPVTPQPQPVQQKTVQPAQSSGANGTTMTGLGGISSGSTVAQPATPEQNTSAVQQDHSVETGFTGASTVSAEPNPQGGMQTVADAGAAEESDDELDARIAGLIGRPN